MKDIGVQELEDSHSHLLIAAPNQLGYQTQPIFVFQLFLGDSLDYVQELLRDKPLKFAERLFLKNCTKFFFFWRGTFAKNELSHVLQERRGGVSQRSLEFFPALEIGKLRELIRGELQEFRHFVINVGSVRSGRSLFASQELGNVGLGHGGGCSQISLSNAQLFQPLFDDLANVHGLSNN